MGERTGYDEHLAHQILLRIRCLIHKRKLSHQPIYDSTILLIFKVSDYILCYNLTDSVYLNVC